jgi:hypothetical protein
MARLYVHADETTLDSALFANPGAEYRGTPFWSWNNRLDAAQLCREIEHMKTMGLGGFHMHPRTGLATEYMGPDYLDCIKVCVEKARSEKMLAWLYDEDRWPSGFAGGLVTRDPAFRAKYLRLTPRPYSADDQPVGIMARATDVPRTGEGRLLARYRIILDDAGCLGRAERLTDGAADEPGLWYAYLEASPCSSWHNNQTYVDVMDPAAIARFIEVTHEVYRHAIGQDFGGVVPAIFTDEPQMTWSHLPPRPEARQDCILPWTTDLADTYRKQWKEDLWDLVPELIWELPSGRRSRARWRFRDHVSERFAQAFNDQIGAWCDKHGLAFTGHLMCEGRLNGQVQFVGDCMRHYRAFQLPGIDLLNDSLELTTAKQAVSVARQDGREGVLSELYGVTNWVFPFQGHKRQGDWQAALGITIRCHHLYMASMEGNAKRDYPASIGHQSPWFTEYRLVEDHFARLNTALVRGKPVVRIAVVHPVESRWLTLGVVSQTAVEAASQEQTFQNVTRWLLDACLDFDFVAESLLPEQCRSAPKKGVLKVGKMAYDAVVVPAMITIRSTTLAKLEAFAEAGGRLVFAGRIPDHVDGVPSRAPARLAKRCVNVDLDRGRLVSALADLAEVEVVHPNGAIVDDVLHQIRQDGKRRWVFLCCHRPKPKAPVPWDVRNDLVTVRVKGRWAVTLYDTLQGITAPIIHRHQGGWTELSWECSAGGHLLLALDPTRTTVSADLPGPTIWKEFSRLGDPVPVTMHEPNVLLLDQAEFRLDDGAWQPLEEIQRAENILRQQCGWKAKHSGVAQPWCEPPSGQRRRMSWRFTIDSMVEVTGSTLALEHLDQATLRLDGQPVKIRDAGWWTDESIRLTTLPRIAAGRHLMEVDLPFTPEGSLECLYLLGDFGVEVQGRHCRLTAPVKTLAWGDWTRQGLPFYAGNLTYHARLRSDGQPISLRAPWFANPLLTVELDGKRVGAIAFDPFRLDLGAVAAGEHRLDLTCYGNRANAFGAVHNSDPQWCWWGPDSWQTSGDAWSYEYRLWPQGVTSAPQMERHG